LLHGRLLDERLRLVVQVPCLAVQILRLGCRGGGHGSQQRHGCDELLACSWGCAWFVDIEVSVDAPAGLLAQLTRTFSTCGGFSSDGGAKQPYREVLLRKLGLELAR
jgi:hypothetical protein